jgi:hypothetical protein
MFIVREALGQHLVERGGDLLVAGLAAHVLAQRLHALLELLVGLELQLGFEIGNSRHTLLVLAELLGLSDVQRTVE